MTSFLKVYSKWMDFIVQVIKIVVAIALVVMTVVTFVEVIRRYAFGLSFVWAEELTRFLLVGVTFIGGAAAYKIGGMACFDLVITHFGKGKIKFTKTFKIIDNLLIALFSVYLAYNGFSYSFAPMVTRMSSAGLKLNMTFVYITIPIGFTLIVLFAIEQIFIIITEKEGDE